MAISKDTMMEWVSELPDDAEIGIEADQRGLLNLIAFFGEDDQHMLVVGGIRDKHKRLNPQADGQQHS